MQHSLSHVSMLTLKDYCASLKNERLKTEKCEKNVPIRVKDFSGLNEGFPPAELVVR